MSKKRRSVEKSGRPRQPHKLEIAGSTEQEMREASAPWPETVEELSTYVSSLVDRGHDYGTCVYAMSLAATAAFHFVAGKLGCTGFQASCADLDVLRRLRSIDGSFLILKAEDMVYPQYDLQARLAKFMEESRPWVAEQAKKNLAEVKHAHPDVISHWRKLADG